MQKTVRRFVGCGMLVVAAMAVIRREVEAYEHVHYDYSPQVPKEVAFLLASSDTSAPSGSIPEWSFLTFS